MILSIPDYFDLDSRELAKAISANKQRNEASHNKFWPNADEAKEIIHVFIATLVTTLK